LCGFEFTSYWNEKGNGKAVYGGLARNLAQNLDQVGNKIIKTASFSGGKFFRRSSIWEIVTGCMVNELHCTAIIRRSSLESANF